MKFQSVAFLSSLPLFSSALLVVPSIEPDSSSPYLRSVAGSIGPDHVQVNFETSCDGCFVGTDDGLEVTIDLHRNDDECTVSGLALNGVPLAPAYWTYQFGDIEGHLSLPTRSSNGIGEREYHTKWNLRCLDNEASLLQVNLFREDGEHQLQSVGGFTASLRQTVQPQVLKLDPTLTTSHVKVLDRDAWAFPSHDEGLKVFSISPLRPLPDVPPKLREELSKLFKYHSGQDRQNKDLEAAEVGVVEIWKAEFSDCSSVKCFLRTATKGASAFAELIAKHFKHHGDTDMDFFKKSPHATCSDKLRAVESSHDQAPLDSTPTGSESDADSMSLQSTQLPPSSPAVPEEAAEQNSPDHPHPPWVEEGGRPPWGDGPPPWIKDGSPPPWAHHGDHPPPSHPHGRPSFDFGHSMLSIRQQWKYRLIAAIMSFVVVTLFAALLFVCVRHRTRIFRDPRRRADCAARREEWKRKKAYRKAACRYRFVTFLRRFRRAVKTTELEEKEGLKLSKEQNEGSAFGQEIGNLRAAHEFVGELVRAEEGRMQGVAELGAGDGASITETLPAYSDPPEYSVGMEGDISVIDGFTGYTASSIDQTPESSIIDCSPRMSFDTQRTTVTRTWGG